MFCRQYLFTFASVALLVTIFFVPVRAQSSEVPKIEAGAQFSLIHLLDLELNVAATTNNQSGGFRRFYQTNVGLGGRLAYNVTKQIALEGEINYFPQTANRVQSKGL